MQSFTYEAPECASDRCRPVLVSITSITYPISLPVLYTSNILPAMQNNPVARLENGPNPVEIRGDLEIAYAHQLLDDASAIALPSRIL